MHPAIELKDPAKAVPMTEELFRKSFPDDLFRRKVVFMLTGYQRVFGIAWQPFAATGRLDRMAFVGLIYPQECFEIVLKEPREKVGERLTARKLRWQAATVDDRTWLTVAWPMRQFRRLVRTWHDLDAAGFTCMLPDRELGMIAGTIEPF